MSENPSTLSQHVTTKELAEKLSEEMTLIDVRTAGEYREGHIPEAKNIPLDTIASYDRDLEKEVYIICRSGRRSSQAADILSQKGYKVINVAGGMLDWHAAVEKEK